MRSRELARYCFLVEDSNLNKSAKHLMPCSDRDSAAGWRSHRFFVYFTKQNKSSPAILPTAPQNRGPLFGVNVCLSAEISRCMLSRRWSFEITMGEFSQQLQYCSSNLILMTCQLHSSRSLTSRRHLLQIPYSSQSIIVVKTRLPLFIIY